MSEIVDVKRQGDAEVRVPRSFSVKYKLEVLAELDAVSERGEVGRILRREGLYSSLITNWRRQRDEGSLAGRKRGPKTDKLASENKSLREQNARLEERLGTLEELVSAQGKVSALLQAMSRESASEK